jgi:hypothetical protein
VTNERLNAAVERLLSDSRFLRRFRRRPERTLAEYELTDAEVEAVKRGSAPELLALGLNPGLVWPRVQAESSLAWLVTRVRPLSPALVLAAMLAPASPAMAAGRRRHAPSRVGRVARYFAQRGVAGDFFSTLGRTGRSGRAISRAASGRGSRSFGRAARSFARQRGIQPPPIEQ